MVERATQRVAATVATMITDLVQIRLLGEKKRGENERLRRHMKSRDHSDRILRRVAQGIEEQIDCTTCANCCRHVSPMLSEEDVARLASHLGMSHDEFIAKYLDKTESDPEFPWMMRIKPCPFLKDNRCSVYEHRPGTCRGYPYLNKPDLVSRTMGMIDRTAVCPAVFEVWEELKRETGFRRDRRR